MHNSRARSAARVVGGGSSMRLRKGSGKDELNVKSAGKGDFVKNSKGSIAIGTGRKYLWRLLVLFVSIPCYIAVMNFIAWRFAEKKLRSDETVEFMPSYGYQLDPNDSFWTLDVNAVVYRSDKSNYFKKIFLDSLLSFTFRYYNKYNINALRNRLSIFLRDFQRGKYIYTSICSLDPELHSSHCESSENLISLNSIGPTLEDGVVNSKLKISKIILNI